VRWPWRRRQSRWRMLRPFSAIALSLDRSSDRGETKRILAISLMVFASSASAQSQPFVDCNAVKNFVDPVDLAYHSQVGTRIVVQAYRDRSGGYIVWSAQALARKFKSDSGLPLPVLTDLDNGVLAIIRNSNCSARGSSSSTWSRFACRGLSRFVQAQFQLRLTNRLALAGDWRCARLFLVE
jgi:hypothetical protein